MVAFTWMINLVPGFPLLFDRTIEEAFEHGCDGCFKPMLNVSLYLCLGYSLSFLQKLKKFFLSAFLGLVPSDDGLRNPLIDNGHHLGQHGSRHGVGKHKSVRYLFPFRHLILYTFPFLSGAARRSQSRWWLSLASSCSASARSAWCSSWRGWPSCPPSPPSLPPTHWPWSTAASSLSSLSTLTHNSEKILSVGYLIVRHKFIKSYC